MKTSRRAARPEPVDLMFGGDEAEALFESWLADEDADGRAAPPVRVVDAPTHPREPQDAEPGGDVEPAGWRPPAMRAPARRPR